MAKKKCYCGIGGQAVLEGIMMKNGTRYSVAVRKPDGTIDVEVGEYTGVASEKIMKIPFVRGIFAFVDSLVLGMRCLNHSAEFYEEEPDPKKDKKNDKKKTADNSDAGSGLMSVLTILLAVALAVGLFVILPMWLTTLLSKVVRSASLLALLEGLIRLGVFLLYILTISLMKDIRRTYMYHGAEHMCINCIERGRELTVDNVMRSSRQHRRCGTSFLLFVMVVSIILFFFIRVDTLALKLVLRILLIPVIAGISYEIIRLAGRSENLFVRIVSAPGMWLQKMTTKKPDRDMVEVAIQAVSAVFDWRAFLAENFGYEYDPEEEEEAEEEKQASEEEPETEEIVFEAEEESEQSDEEVSDFAEEDEYDEPFFLSTDEE